MHPIDAHTSPGPSGGEGTGTLFRAAQVASPPAPKGGGARSATFRPAFRQFEARAGEVDAAV